MASANLRDELSCSICLNIYIDPITLRCGHNFCRGCIDCVLNTQQAASRTYTCPDCREEFLERPVLQRNITLHNVAECIRSTQPEKEETGISCTYCIHTATLAVKSCLLCEACLCEDHLRVHSNSAEHVLSEPTTNPGSRKCSVHKKILEYFCLSDAKCICTTCIVDGDHKGHQVISMPEASERKKEELRNVLEQLFVKREKIEKRVQSLPENTREVQGKALSITERSTVLFKDLRRQLDDLEINILSQISRLAMQASLSVSDLIQDLEKQKDELSTKICHIEEIRRMADPFIVLQDDVLDFHDLQMPDEDTVGKLDLDLIMNTVDLGLSKIVAYEDRGIFLKEASSLRLDVSSASNYVKVSDDLKSASMSTTSQKFPKTPERFGEYQVLSSGGFSSGKHYWDVETSKTGLWTVGMAYPSIERSGDLSCIGYNCKSWGLRYSEDQCSARHNKRVFSVPYSKSSHTFRVCLDYEAGQLSFYELSDPIRHLYTFTTTFTEPLHAAFRVWGDSWVRLRN
ncbi:E3 ubiquitin-protein ligase TRIM39-like [Bufo gargarizans]|uniref:E3 ubiquitin-protein ligase TRIM39-like n=1 Tax=Bufo gargarizans TaxID=30331 RepID=UPI001CF2C597|nr:E3 ubiquitin-protein ligase TRIM39-like [Bufo gargarizans]